MTWVLLLFKAFISIANAKQSVCLVVIEMLTASSAKLKTQQKDKIYVYFLGIYYKKNVFTSKTQ